MTGVQIDPTNIFDDDALFAALELSSKTLAKARAAGEIRFVRKGNRTFYRGQWILDWLEGQAAAAEREAHRDD